MDPTDTNAADAAARLHRARRDVDAFEEELDRNAVRDPARFALRQWFEAYVTGPILDAAERRLRGIQGKN